ncbi:MAG: exopolyphosphatase [Bacteroidota bacterium]
MELSKYAAIDIGSNAVRLLICNVIETDKEIYFRKSQLTRVPVRLGIESFIEGKISKTTANRLIEAMKGFKHLMNANEVVHYKGCATSAMRDASNGADIVSRIKKEAGIDIDVISGKLEAEIIFSTHIEALIEGVVDFLYVDVGGGSTELTLFHKGKLIVSKSFNIGTLRVLNNMVTEKDWSKMYDWLQEHASIYKDISIIGSGGNINKMFKMSMKELGKPLDYKYLMKQYKMISSMTYEERMIQLELNPDRADVIIPALQIYLNIMNCNQINTVFVPKIGLSDGIVRYAYKDYNQSHHIQKRSVFKSEKNDD